MKTILERINTEYNKLVAGDKAPDSLFLGTEGHKHLKEQAALIYGAKIEETFLDMQVYVSAQYQGDAFRIYCKPEF